MNVTSKSFSFRRTLKGISENCNFMILYKNNWTNLEEIEAKLIKSGTVWRIKASCEGYKEEVFSLLIDWYQDQLIVSASLKKL